MRTKRERSSGRSETGTRLDLVLSLLLAVAGLGVRWPYVRAVVFPPLDDPAFYLTTAQNLVSGRGLVVDALWSYQLQPSGVTHPSHEHWMPLTTGLIGAAFVVMGTSFRAGQLPGLVLGTLLAPLTYVLGRRALPGGRSQRWVALSAGLFVAANATLSYQSASAESSTPFAAIGTVTLVAAARGPGRPGHCLGAGLLVALAYLTRADGLLLLIAVPVAWWLTGQATFKPAGQAGGRTAPSNALVSLGALAAGFALLVVPWLGRNYRAFGTPMPGSLLSQAWLCDYVDTFNYETQPGPATLLAAGGRFLLAQRGEALLNNGRVFLLTTFPWGVLALPGLWLLRREAVFALSLIYGMLLFLVTALVFPISSRFGTYYHSLGAMVPVLALAAVYAVGQGLCRLGRRKRMIGPLGAGVMAGLMALSGAQAVLALPAVSQRHQAEREQFAAIADWLAEHASPGDVLMTTQPYTLNYASTHPCIPLPGRESVEAAWEAAQRYGARFLVITQPFGHYPAILHEHPDPRFRLVERTGGTEIYAIGAQ